MKEKEIQENMNKSIEAHKETLIQLGQAELMLHC